MRMARFPPRLPLRARENVIMAPDSLILHQSIFPSISTILFHALIHSLSFSLSWSLSFFLILSLLDTKRTPSKNGTPKSQKSGTPLSTSAPGVPNESQPTTTETVKEEKDGGDQEGSSHSHNHNHNHREGRSAKNEDEVTFSDSSPERPLRRASTRELRSTRGSTQKYDMFFTGDPDTEADTEMKKIDVEEDSKDNLAEDIKDEDDEAKEKKRQRSIKQQEEREAKAEAKRKRDAEREKEQEEKRQKKMVKKKIQDTYRNPEEALQEITVVVDVGLLDGAGLELFQKLKERELLEVKAENLAIPRSIQFRRTPTAPADQEDKSGEPKQENGEGSRLLEPYFENFLLFWEELAVFKQMIVDKSIRKFIKNIGEKKLGNKVLFLIEGKKEELFKTEESAGTSQPDDATDVNPQDLEKNMVALQFEMDCKIIRPKDVADSAYLIEVIAKSIATVPDL